VQQSILSEPTLEAPNQERNIADINLAAARVTEVPLLPRPPSSTTPIRINNSGPSGEIPRSAAAESTERDAANLISIPDFPLPAGKMLAVPPVNQIADAHMSGGGGQANGGSESASGNLGTGTGAAAGSGHGSEPGGGAGVSPSASLGGGTGGAGVAELGGRGSGRGTLATGNGNGPGAGAGAGSGPGSASGPGEGNGSEAGLAGHITRIVKPQDGRFPAVVLGSAVSGQYPESVGVLGGRLVYTVYLRVGTKKSWILQYCLPRSAEQAVKVKGAATPVDPPYPYLILRPALEFVPDMDYLIIHGVVNSSGKFEQLAIVGATDFPQEHLVLSSLRLWQFRPASRDGQPTSVEVLLIIPREEV